MAAAWRSMVGRLSRAYHCPRCSRPLSMSSALLSGHNKWSKIRHDKAVKDGKKNTNRNFYSRNIALFSKLYGSDLQDNPQLSNWVAIAKKAGVPKSLIDSAIAQGQGRSNSGAKLEPIVFEVLHPSGVALVVTAETDNKARALQDLRTVTKKLGATNGSTTFLFTRKGRVVFESKAGVGLDHVMDAAIEAGADDVDEDDDGSIAVWVEPANTARAAKSLAQEFGLAVTSSDIVWSPVEDRMAVVDSDADAALVAELVVALQEVSGVEAIYSNAAKGTVSDEAWAKMDENLDG